MPSSSTAATAAVLVAVRFICAPHLIHFSASIAEVTIRRGVVFPLVLLLMAAELAFVGVQEIHNCSHHGLNATKSDRFVPNLNRKRSPTVPFRRSRQIPVL